MGHGELVRDGHRPARTCNSAAGFCVLRALSKTQEHFGRIMHRAVRTSSLALLCAGFAIGLPAAARAADFAQVYQDALANDPTYQQAHATYMAAREARPEAWAVLLPQITGAAGKTWTHSAGLFTQSQVNAAGKPAPFSIYSTSSIGAKQWSLNLSEDLFSWSDWMGLKAADSQVAEAQATYEAAAQNLILRAA